MVVICKSEIGAAFAADGYAKASGKVGRVVVNTGTSCMNILMSLKTSAKDGIPVLVIIGTNRIAIMNNEHYF